MGSGAFGSNGSVHWKVVHTADEKDAGFLHGRDPNKKGGPVNTQGMFRIKLRFADDAEARKALTTAADASRNGAVYVLVPARKRLKETDDMPWEIEIDW
jgi:hypothetical protein